MIVSIGLLIGLLLVLIAIIALIRVAFKDDIIWGVLCLLILPIPLYLLLHPARNRYVIAFFLIGLTTTFLSLWGGADQVLGLKAKAEDLGIAHLPLINKLRSPPVIVPVIEEEIAEEAVSPEAELRKKKAVVDKPVAKKRESKFRTVSKTDLAGYPGAVFQGKTYDGRLIQGVIMSATAENVTLSRSVSQGSADFNYSLAEFESIMIATP